MSYDEELFERANRLTDAIMAKLGALHLNAALQPPISDIFTKKIDSRSEIWNVVICFLGEEKADG